MPVALMTSTIKSEPGRAMIFSDDRPEPWVSESVAGLRRCGIGGDLGSGYEITADDRGRGGSGTLQKRTAVDALIAHDLLLFGVFGRQCKRTLAISCPLEAADDFNVVLSNGVDLGPESNRAGTLLSI